MNVNGELLLNFCSEHNLLLGNTFFKKDEYATWRHHNKLLKKAHILDFCVISKQLKKSMIDCGVNSSLQFHNVTSDHRPVFLHLAAPNVYSSPSPKVRRKVKRSKPVSIDFAVLKNDSFYQRRLLLEIEHQLSRSGMDFSFESFNNVLTAACKKHLPKRKRIRAACWMSVNIVRIRELLNRRRRAKISWLSIGRPEGPTKSLYLEEKSLCQRELRAIKYQYYIDKTKLAYTFCR